MQKPTKTVITQYKERDEAEPRDAITETTIEALCSVEIGATAKGDVQIKSVKVYASNPNDAADQAMATFRRIQDSLSNGKSDAVMAQEAALGREWATDDAVENS